MEKTNSGVWGGCCADEPRPSLHGTGDDLLIDSLAHDANDVRDTPARQSRCPGGGQSSLPSNCTATSWNKAEHLSLKPKASGGPVGGADAVGEMLTRPGG